MPLSLFFLLLCAFLKSCILSVFWVFFLLAGKKKPEDTKGSGLIGTPPFKASVNYLLSFVYFYISVLIDNSFSL